MRSRSGRGVIIQGPELTYVIILCPSKMCNDIIGRPLD
jgi:hypothetical protein